jgi:Outer membrane protein beta-barrel family
MKGYNLRNDLLFRKKFNKRGRTFSLALQYLQNNSNGNGNQYSVNDFYFPTGLPAGTDTINQRNETSAGLSGYTARAVYTEPVFKKAILEFSAAKSSTHSNSDRTTYDYNYGSGKFDQINPLLSNDFENRYGYTNTGIRFRKQFKKFNWAAGAAWQLAELEGQNSGSGKDTLISKQFWNILPNARVQYNFNRFSNIMLNYNAQTIQPTVTQLQPVPDISNPLQIIYGNPDLKQEYVHLLQTSLFFVNPIKNRNFFAFMLFRQVNNKIVNYDIINQLGIKTTRPVNVNGVYSINGDINWGIPLSFMKRSSLNIGLGIMHAKNKQFINTEENRINDWQLRPEVRLEMNPHEKFNISVMTSSSLNYTRYSLQPSLDTRYLSYELGTEFGWQLPANFYLSSDFNYTINAKRADGFNVNIPLWNAAFSKQFLKYNRAQLGIRVNDILNKNTGITRTSNNNYIEDRQVVILQRYFLLQFTYSLSKSGLNNPGGGGNMKIITR